MSRNNLFTCELQLESGTRISGLQLQYAMYGTLNAERNNVIWVFHALTANAEPDVWWSGLFGKGNVLDPEKYCIICVNMPGSCYGSYSPADTDAYGAQLLDRFPLFTIRDMVHAYQQLRDALGITRIDLAIGGSMGGMQALEWAICEPESIRHLVLLACNHQQSPWGIAFNTSQRMAIAADDSFSYGDGKKGLEAARAIAMLSYRNYRTFCLTQEDAFTDFTIPHKAESYVRHQGIKLRKRFTAHSYYALTKSMDSHHVGRGRTDVQTALRSIRAKTLVIGIDSDILFPVVEQAFLARHIPGASLEIISSTYGHDGFLIEHGKIRRAIFQFFTHFQKEQVLCAINH
jgi:homoserine O-acetyltransferase